MVAAQKVVLYTLPDCDVSDQARKGLREEGVDFEERDVMKAGGKTIEVVRVRIMAAGRRAIEE